LPEPDSFEEIVKDLSDKALPFAKQPVLFELSMSTLKSKVAAKAEVKIDMKLFRLKVI
jgi:hypothetical protein